MKVVIVGGGAVGFQLAQQLIRENRDVVIIERDPEQARMLGNRLDCMIVNGPGNNVDVLREAGTGNADCFIAVTTSDEVNMIACALVSSEFDVPRKIARVRNIEYSGSRLAEAGVLGIDHVVNPETETAKEIITSIEQGALSDVIAFEATDLQIQTLNVTAHTPVIGSRLRDLGQHINARFLIALIVRDGTYIIPSGDNRVQEGDQIYVVATARDTEAVFARFGKPRRALNKVVLVGGGGKIGNRIAEHFLGVRSGSHSGYDRLKAAWRKRTVNLKIVERDYQKCKELANRYKAATTIHADIADESLFEEEQFGESDLVVAVTDNQELNMVTALYARSVGIPRTVCLVNNSGYADIAARLGIDVPVSLKKSMVDAILKIIRRGSVRNVRSLFDGQIELLELQISSDSSMIGRPLQDVSLPAGTLIVSVTSQGTAIIPDGRTVLNAGDGIVVMLRQEHSDRVVELFSPEQT
ncbi:MAG: Trk system potassium transporter TrkA [Spirochaetaceae bacterium]|nr:MAG: Trk system potassium transporter TrkA [Spirochaetaceae bacterium]